MLIKTIIKKIGNSYYVLIPKYFKDDLNLKEEDSVSIDIQKIKDNLPESLKKDKDDTKQVDTK